MLTCSGENRISFGPSSLGLWDPYLVTAFDPGVTPALLPASFRDPHAADPVRRRSQGAGPPRDGKSTDYLSLAFRIHDSSTSEIVYLVDSTNLGSYSTAGFTADKEPMCERTSTGQSSVVQGSTVNNMHGKHPF